MTASQVAEAITDDATCRAWIVAAVRRAEFTPEELHGLLGMFQGYERELAKQGLLPMTKVHVIHAVDAGITTVLDARGDI